MPLFSNWSLLSTIPLHLFPLNSDLTKKIMKADFLTKLIPPFTQWKVREEPTKGTHTPSESL